MTEFSCSHCGYRSTEAGFFRLERPWLVPYRRWYCVGCGPYRPTPHEKMSVFLPVILITAAALVFTLIRGGAGSRLGHLLWPLGLLYPMIFVTILVHEIGHIVAAASVGMRVTRLIVGTGPVLWAGHTGVLRIELRAIPTTGRAMAHPRSADQPRGRQAVFGAGGVAANAIVAVAAWRLLHWVGRDGSRSLYDLLTLLMWTNAGSAIANLIPFMARIGQQRLPSDGRRLLMLARERNRSGAVATAHVVGEAALLIAARRYADAHALLRPAWEAHTDDVLILTLHVGMMGEVMPKRSVIDWFVAQHSAATEKDGGTPAHVALHLTVAWIAVETRDPALAPMARSFAAIVNAQKAHTAEATPSTPRP